jgi:hypothetical protein
MNRPIVFRPLDPDEFEYVFSLAAAAIDQKIPVGSLETAAGKSILVEDGGEMRQITFNDSAETRMMDAVHHHYKEDAEGFKSAGMRLMILYRHFIAGDLSEFAVDSPQGKALHRAVVRAAASVPLQLDPSEPDCDWDMERLFGHARELRARLI